MSDDKVFVISVSRIIYSLIHVTAKDSQWTFFTISREDDISSPGWKGSLITFSLRFSLNK